MGSNEEGKTTQSDKPAQVQAPPPPEQSNVHVYHHDWAAMQAYYGPRVAITPQYYNSNGHAPPYIWGSPSPMMAPYGTPYPPFCPPGGVYAHPALQMGTQPQGAVSQATPVVATPLNLEAHPANSSGNTDQGFMKKLKEFDGLAMSISNNKTGSAEHSSEPKNSQSSENDDSSNGSDGNATGGEQSRKKRSREGSPNNDGKPSSQIVPLLRDENEKQAVTMGTPVMPTVLDFPQPRHGAPHEVWNEKEVKREKRKQSNRESARRSRLRKQAETEELSVKVDALVAENMTLRSKLGQLNDESEKLRLENQALLDQLKAQATGKTENLISGVDKNNNSVSGSSSSSKNAEQQLLNVSLRTDSVAAS
ncbi:PREDICTED: G-box-binding factor 2 isoform X2 [Brassica oleracea var. oleracea]|uniref:G-box-binding factor 2 isoform X2 n=1 Tax=Brassica oleracea var. oleracea TaxID=109376 RepID=UPI0006A74DCD|nr:PREDICTED: G-box-binding factor 2 isoform X2 [Brassica oleracea var. oleracea]XP_013611855.1 PREDICTED: G-box-binding factor 2 isoform X2 [Brassica oleracea var. oleracea]